MIYINETEVLKLLTWDETFHAVEVSMRRVSEGRVDQIARSKIKILNRDKLLFTMPGYLDDTQYGAMGCKLITVFPNNSRLPKPLPNLIANIFYMDEETGVIKAIVAGTEITKWRTAAASAVATKHIYGKKLKPGSSQILAIFGSGEQGRIHAHCFKYFFNFGEIRIWNRTVSNGQALARELNETYKTDIFKFVRDRKECVDGADVIITVTSSPEPVVLADWVKPGAHINAVGASNTHFSELDKKLYDCSDVFIDYWNGAKVELKGLIDEGMKFKGEVGEVIKGNLMTVDERKITIFQGLGMAVEDCAMARMIYDKFMNNQSNQKSSSTQLTKSI
ncbi:unnamed protein product [Phaedon cochleariae]|uniref:Ketimine reductase mu-crystallin n=1 Tax=Phaedon cochleariae TaxID=80249 RepID=A0A9N9X0S6_PHACE|nr:unnamed protein product [Phaedon cochleariae]